MRVFSRDSFGFTVGTAAERQQEQVQVSDERTVLSWRSTGQSPGLHPKRRSRLARAVKGRPRAYLLMKLRRYFSAQTAGNKTGVVPLRPLLYTVVGWG